MIERSISGPKDSVVTSTSGCPIIQSTSFSQLVSTFEPMISSIMYAPIMSASSRILKIFSTLLERANPFRTRDDRSMPTHPDKEFNHRRFRDALVLTPLPFLVSD